MKPDRHRIDGQGKAVTLTRLKRRSDFLRAARSRQSQARGLILHAHRRNDAGEDREIRFGVTCSKKLGSAVLRNRAKRRLREAARQAIPGRGMGGWDYVLVGRAEVTVRRTFSDLVADLERALASVHRPERRDRNYSQFRKQT